MTKGRSTDCFHLSSGGEFISLVNQGERLFVLDSLEKNQWCELKEAIQDVSTCAGFNRANFVFVLRLSASVFGVNRMYDYHQWTRTLELAIRDYLSVLGLEYFDAVACSASHGVNNALNTQEIIMEEIWPQMELLVMQGLARCLATCDYSPVKLQRLLRFAKIPPAINLSDSSFECSTGFVDFCEKIDIRRLNVFESDESIQHQVERCFIQPTENNVPILEPSNNSSEGIWPSERHFKVPRSRVAVKAAVSSSCSAYEFSLEDTYSPDFLTRVVDSLTNGAGYILAKKLFLGEARRLKGFDFSPGESRWNGAGSQDVLDLAINRSSDVLSLLDSDLIASIVESLLGWDCLVDNIAFSTSRANSECFGPHQDSPFEQNPGAKLPPHDYPLSIQCIFCIDDFTASNGAFYVIPGSHKSQLRVNLPSQGNLPRGVPPVESVPVYAQSGDAIIAVGNIWHGAYANETSVDRRALLIEYVSSIVEVRDKMSAEMLLPEVLTSLSPRLLRLLGAGKHFKGSENNLQVAWSRSQIKKKYKC